MRRRRTPRPPRHHPNLDGHKVGAWRGGSATAAACRCCRCCLQLTVLNHRAAAVSLARIYTVACGTDHIVCHRITVPKAGRSAGFHVNHVDRCRPQVFGRRAMALCVAPPKDGSFTPVAVVWERVVPCVGGWRELDGLDRSDRSVELNQRDIVLGRSAVVLRVHRHLHGRPEFSRVAIGARDAVVRSADVDSHALKRHGRLARDAVRRGHDEAFGDQASPAEVRPQT